MKRVRPNRECFARHSTLRRSVVQLLAAALLAGCVTWQPSHGGPYALRALIDQHPGKVRVSLEHGGRVVLYAPEQTSDSLIGFRQARAGASRVAIPMREVVRVDVKRADDGRTALLLGAISVTALVVGVEVSAAMDRMKHSFSLP